MRYSRLVLLVTVVGVSARADMHEVVKITFDGHEAVQESFLQGRKMRSESRGPDGSRSVTIQDPDRQKAYDVDMAAQEYVEIRPVAPDFLGSLAMWIRRPVRVRESGKTVNVSFETTDTGERKTFFGRTARHLLLRETYVAEPGACMSSHRVEKDGWYFAPADVRSNDNGSYRLVYFVGGNGRFQCRDRMIFHGNPGNVGEAAFEVSGPVTRELINFSGAPLDRGLFEPPNGFRKVDALQGQRMMSWSEKMGVEFTQLGGAFASWFE